MEWYWITLIAIGGFIFLLLFVSVILFIICFARRNKVEKPTKKFKSKIGKLNDGEIYNLSKKGFDSLGENISLKMRDGATMYARIFKKESAKKTIIFYHGFTGSPMINFYHEFNWLKNENINLVFIFSRGHSISGGKIITMGYKEKDDLHEWVDYVYSLLNTPIYLWGISMGCATILFSLEKAYKEYIKGIVADSGFTNIYKEYVYSFRPYCGIVLSNILVFMISIWFKLLFRISIRKLKTNKVINNTNVPILFVHASKDKTVSSKYTLLNYETYKGDKDLLLVDSSKHAKNMLYANKEYVNKVKALLDLN